jgi:hypothetical protein
VGVACASAIPAPPKVPAASTVLTAVGSFRLGFIMLWCPFRRCQPVWTEDHTVPTGRYAFAERRTAWALDAGKLTDEAGRCAMGPAERPT